ncbi:protein-glutamate O-methyltransferase CheR [Pacificimonas sp. WHA3]|uniref:Chemotaxis protein methyltransferase n=1 Tax=Pacificimonas pallii TaxID=2827236 RepID=A0ABS6SGV4_9SPHN|nr:CheR family methyltransferase [Pacificimonas pallii]MBV7257156.1 protein-glutamate O-methyltransferase CheR [Pacificimonas pallii]
MTALAMTSAPREREFGYRAEDHRAISTMVYDEVGILLPAEKAQLVYRRLAPRVRACNLATISEYIELIGRDERERKRMIDSLTTNHTSFFRESHHFEDFSERIWPGLVERLNNGGRVRLWSAACSSGEEPYTWLMSALGADRTAASKLLRKDFRVLATDISSEILAAAKRACYSEETLSKVPRPLRSSWIQEKDGVLQVDPVLRDAISFRSLNLLGKWPMKGKFDTIFCRNVMIYFDQPTKTKLQTRLADALEVGGMLYIGHSERLAPSLEDRFRCIGRTSYQKVAA